MPHIFSSTYSHSSTPCVRYSPPTITVSCHFFLNLIVLPITFPFLPVTVLIIFITTLLFPYRSYHLPLAAAGPGQEDVSNVSFCAGRYRSLWWQKPSPSLWSSPWNKDNMQILKEKKTVQSKYNMCMYLCLSPHLTSFVLPGHIV